MSAKPKTKTKTTAVDDLTFEQAFQELETLVRQMEAGQLPLEEALTVFERGQALAARCGVVLENAELKVRQLAAKPTGGYTVQDFEETED